VSRPLKQVRLEEATSHEATVAIEEFADWVARLPGTWGVSVREQRFKKNSVDVHLVVHADLDLGTSDGRDDMHLEWWLP
jgi:hypothetical protein